MNAAKTLAAAATITAALALNTGTAHAALGTCTITAQPFDGRSYALAAVVDGSVVNLITKQHGMLEGPTSFTFTAPSGVVGDLTGVTEVWWAARNPARQATAADFYDTLHVNPDCRFATPYHAIPGKQDSVVIRVATLPTVDPTTTQPAPTTTSTTAVEPTTTTSTVVDLPPATTRPAPTTTHGTTPEPPSSTTSEVTTTTTGIVVDVPLVEQPTTTTAPTPEVPSSSTAPVDVDLYTATSVERHAGTLPVTGAAWLPYLVVAGCLSAMLGGLLAMFRPVRRRYAEVGK